ncbi:helix-turn-helix domain-containing protein [Pseudenterobacter timonensis]|uniref:Helix-turn-helix domain-containing protein n=1 Tax=Pseudenterobacter timonensis TaxID=1755099 RepID=A0AAE4IWA3_9ENTR|nr:helix-turn-helix domain-containing protein [Pseudenterobacter timonensis]MDR9891417.1 helix-turn-helix domain-containing protein [Pseudenterobacter timonensis]
MIKVMTVTDMLSYIEENLENKISLDTIIDYTGYSRRYIQILFKRHINMPLWQYIKYRRISRAALLLRLTSSKIIDVAFRLQFDSQQSFNREFKKIMNCTPLQYRKMKAWDLAPIVSSRAVDFKHPTPPEICSLDKGIIYGSEVTYEQDITEASRPFPLRWRIIENHLQSVGSPVYLLTSYKKGNKSNQSIKINTFIGSNDKNSAHKIKSREYDEGEYVRMTYKGTKEEYINCVNHLYLVTLPYYQLKRKEGYDIEKITKDSCGLSFELLVPVTL